MPHEQPIIPGFYPDPSICRAGDMYYVVNSSFEYLPGLPIHSSEDLVTWSFVGNALTRASQIREHAGSPSSSVYAPTIRHHDGRFWIVWTDTLRHNEGAGQYIIHADNPAGPWSDPVEVRGTVGIDPDLAWDEDGICHLTWASHQSDLHPLATVAVDPMTGELLSTPRRLWGGTGGANAEGPHLYRIDGWWYLLAAEGGTERAHAVTIARARTLDAPFESAPTNPILTHRGLAHPVQNVGHGDLVELVGGGWAMVHLGVRPRGATPGFHVNGRETFIVGVDWVNGWPVIDENRYEPQPRNHSFVDDFAVPALNGRWLGVGMFPGTFTRSISGGIAIDSGVGPGVPILATRVVDVEWTAEATVRVDRGTCRLVLRIDESHHYAVTFDGTVASAVATIGPAIAEFGRVTIAAGSSATLKIRVRLPEATSVWGEPEPDIVDLSVLDADGSERLLASLDGRYVSTEVAGLFTGRVVGVKALSGSVELSRFVYTQG